MPRLRGAPTPPLFVDRRSTRTRLLFPAKFFTTSSVLSVEASSTMTTSTSSYVWLTADWRALPIVVAAL